MRLPKPVKRTAKAKKRPAKKSKAPRRKLIHYADSLWSQIIRRRGVCQVCGKTERLQAAHGFSRRYHATRWNLLNGRCLCSGCHVRYTFDPIGWDDILRGEGVCELWEYEDLRTTAQSNKRVDLEQTIAALEAVLHSGAAVPAEKERAK